MRRARLPTVLTAPIETLGIVESEVGSIMGLHGLSLKCRSCNDSLFLAVTGSTGWYHSEEYDMEHCKLYALSTCGHCKACKKLISDCGLQYEFTGLGRRRFNKAPRA
jgi:hypothetical protein